MTTKFSQGGGVKETKADSPAEVDSPAGSAAPSAPTPRCELSKRRVTPHFTPGRQGCILVMDDPVYVDGVYIGWRWVASARLDVNAALALRDELIEGLAK